MKREELMINDIVFDYTKTPVKVCAVGQDIVVKNSFGVGSLEPNELSPIPLTEEILVKNGFVKTWNGDWQLKEYSTIIISKDYYVEIFERTIRIDYVHELQHILHSACVEKELVID